MTIPNRNTGFGTVATIASTLAPGLAWLMIPREEWPETIIVSASVDGYAAAAGLPPDQYLAAGIIIQLDGEPDGPTLRRTIYNSQGGETYPVIQRFGFSGGAPLHMAEFYTPPKSGASRYLIVAVAGPVDNYEWNGSGFNPVMRAFLSVSPGRYAPGAPETFTLR